ncbi:putative baseplate assembly protein [Caballeronia cordobensis]|uniref:putative baseplate assembly protein n=1 Tax=Caballeronia cordobensis TaxID=1353886 RepID=UPI00045F072A|nr:putative membrane protein [Burkholderia sp. RPE67]
MSSYPARPPRIALRDGPTIAADLSAHRAGYLPGWTAHDDAGSALLRIVARNLDIQAAGLNAMPLRLQLEFLDQIGASVLPAQSARAPLVFTLLANAAADATVPAGTRVAAVLPPPAPSLDSGATSNRSTPPEFFTEQEITAMRGTIAALYSIDPQADAYADHGASVQSGFTAFASMRQAPHRLYLGHADMFRLAGSAQVDVTIDFADAMNAAAGTPARRPLLLDWEYLSTDGWLPLVLIEDRTERFTRDGRISLSKDAGPDGQSQTLAGHEAYWVRASVSQRIPCARIATGGDGKTARPYGIHPEWTEVTVESSRDLLPGDVVTIDGVTRATVTGTLDAAVLLDLALADMQASDFLVLADALPPLRPEGADQSGSLPMVDVLRARVGYAKNDLVPDSALQDEFRLDLNKDFYPFGTQPERFAAFYVACKEAFPRKGARIELMFTFSQTGGASGTLDVQSEYYNGARWVGLGPNEEYSDNTLGLTQGVAPGGTGLPAAAISFVAPQDWAECEINADQQHWLRLRLASGDYGKPLSLSVEPDPADSSKFIVKSVAPTLKPPVVASLRISYLYFSNPAPLDACLTENDFAFAEHSEDAYWPRSPFAPFEPVSDRAPALHFGFSGQPPAALVSVLAHVIAPAADAAPQPYAWDYWGSRGWTELSVRDTTLGFQQTGLVQFIGAPDMRPRDGLGGPLYRVRARLKTGLASEDYRVQLGGVWLNAVGASQGQAIDRDTMGTSSGQPDQTFVLPAARAPRDASANGAAANTVTEFERALELPANGVPVMAGEVLEVREWAGRGDDWETAVAGVDPARLRFETDAQDTSIKTAVWVRWLAVPHLYASGPGDRHYVVERARGVFRFPGAGGFIPPAGAPIVISYVTGGGIIGNVDAGVIRELHSGVGYVNAVSNPLPASGGAQAENLRAARDRTAQQTRHRDRAVSMEDYEWLAMSATPEVARVRALPLESPDGRGARGYVGLVLVPASARAQPMPSLELKANVARYLSARMPAGIAGNLQLFPPVYVQVGVHAEVLPSDADEAGRVEARLRERLASFLHSLTGGREGRGWQFGQTVALSDLAALFEETPGVDAVRFLQMMVGQTVYGDTVPVGPDQLIAAGDSQLKLVVPDSTGASYAAA